MRKFLVFILFLGASFCAQAQIDGADDQQALNVDSILETASEQAEEQDEEYQYDTEEEGYLEEEEYDENDTIPNWDQREVNKTEWEKIKKDKRFIYKKRKPEKKKKTQKGFDGSFFNSGAVKIILYILFGGFLLYIIYLFIKNNDLSFKRNIKDEEVVQEEPWENVQSFDEWELALQKALREKDFRLATRIYYLHTLSILDKTELVRYQEDKTNWYYVQKLFGSSYHDDFMALTKSFDYIWYGEYQISEKQFAQLQEQFKSFHYKIA